MAITSEDCAQLLAWLEASHDPASAREVWETFPATTQAILEPLRSWRDKNLAQQQTADELARFSAQRMDQLLGISPVALYAFTPQDLRITYMSQSITNLIGYPPPDASNREQWWADKILPADLDAALKNLRTWIEQEAPGILQRSYRVRNADGHVVWVVSQTRALRDEHGKILEIVGALSDISAQVALTEQLEQIAHHMPGAIFQFRQDTDGNYTIPYASPGIKDLIGFNPSEIRNNPALILTRIHPDDQGTVPTLAGYTANDLSEWRAIYRIMHPHKGTIWVEIRTTPVMQDDGSLLWSGIALDLTETMHTQETLRDYQERMELVIQGTGAGIWDWNIKTGKIVSNRVWTDILGLPAEAADEANVETWHSLLHPEDLPESMACFEEHARGLAPDYRCDLRIMTTRQPWHWIRMHGRISSRGPSGEPLRMSGILLDINAEHLAREALADQLVFQDRLIDTLPNPIFIKNSELRFVNVNKAYEQAFGIKREDIIGRTVLDLNYLPMDSRIKYQAEDQRLLDEQDTAHREIKFLFADGHWHHCLYWSTGFGTDRVATRGIVGIIVDISEQKRIARQLAKARQEAELATEAKSQFLANMSHEIRTPMNAILGMLGLLHRTKLDRLQRDYAGKIDRASRSLLEIINEVLDYSKIEAGKLQLDPAPFDLHEVLDTLSAILQGNIGDKNIELVFDIALSLPGLLFGDALRLQQILLNLLGNALKFTDKGEIILEVRELNRTDTSITLTFTVHDTGIGIPQNKQQLVFHEFAQAESSTTRHYGGTGLGLAICRHLVSLMGGELRLASAEGHGSSFSFTLSLPYQAVTQTQVGHGQLILVIDDTPASCRAFAALCELGGYQVRTAASSRTAADLLSGGLRPAAILLDSEIPDPELLRADLFEREPATPTIFTFRNSSLDMPEHQHLRLIKPVTPNQFYTTLDEALQAGSHHRTPLPRHGERLLGLRLLVVEDNPLNQEVARELLRGEGAEVEIATNGREALQRAATGLHDLDAVLMDIQMPDVDGYTVAHEMRLHHGVLIPIIAMTANTLKIDRQASLDAGMNAHIGKPIDLNQLIQTLRELCFRELIPMEAPALPEIMPEETPGIDHQGALARLGGNMRLYAALAREFGREQQSRLSRLHRALEQNDLESAIRESHTLKGVAGTLGVMELMRHADTLEQHLKYCRESGASHEVSPEILEAEVREATQALESWAKLAGGSVPTVVSDMTETLQAVPPHLLDALINLLEQGNMLAMDSFTELEAATGPNDIMTQLRNAMLNLDFPTAVSLCLLLKQERAL